jgi:hypothetical protein
LINPILVPYENALVQGWGKSRMEQTRQGQRGPALRRAFDAGSDAGVCAMWTEGAAGCVFGRLTYPRNQTFDGAWRKVSGFA